MFEVLIREAGARFGLGDKALPLLQMLLASMTRKDTGGLAGFLEQFKAAGLGPIVQSWLGGGPAAQALSNEQVKAALGAPGGLLSQITTRLNIGAEPASAALGYLLPPVVGLLTPGGSLPAHMPAEVTALAATGEGLLAAPVAGSAGAAAGAGDFMKWLPWAAAALAAVLGLTYCNKDRGATTTPVNTTPPAQTAPATTGDQTSPTPATPATPAAESASAAASAESPMSGSASDTVSTSGATTGTENTSANTEAGHTTTAPAAETASAAPAAANAASAAGNTPESVTESATESAAAHASAAAGARVEALTVQDKPALKVFFDSGKTDVHADFSAKAAALLAWLQAHPSSQAVISGFNDPTGNAAANAELSRQRAQAVQNALVALGVPAERTVLEKPAEATDTSAASLAESRRVEVMVRD